MSAAHAAPKRILKFNTDTTKFEKHKKLIRRAKLYETMDDRRLMDHYCHLFGLAILNDNLVEKIVVGWKPEATS